MSEGVRALGKAQVRNIHVYVYNNGHVVIQQRHVLDGPGDPIDLTLEEWESVSAGLRVLWGDYQSGEREAGGDG